MAQIDKTAIVQEGATLAKDVTIGAYAFVSSEAILEQGVSVGQGARVCGKIMVGKNVKIYPYAIVGSEPQDLKFDPSQKTSTIIGDNVTIREFATVNRGTIGGGGVTRVGNNVLIMNYCHIAHDCQVGDGVIMSNNATLAGHVEIGENTVIGGLTPVHQFVKIGEGCMIGGASAISQDIPPFCLAEGNRAKIRGLNIIGLRRRFDKEDIDALKEAFKQLFRSDKLLKESATKLLATSSNEKVKKICQFVLETKRGIPYERQMNE